MSSFQPGKKLPAEYTSVDTTTYLLARDEDCENAFHSTADFVSNYLNKIVGLNLIFCVCSDEHVFS